MSVHLWALGAPEEQPPRSVRLALAKVAPLLRLLLPLRLSSGTIAALAAIAIATADITAATAVIATITNTAAAIAALLLPVTCGGRRTRCYTPARKSFFVCSFAIVSLHLWALLGAAELLGSTLTLTERTCVWVRGLGVKGFETLTLTPKTDLTLTLTPYE